MKKITFLLIETWKRLSSCYTTTSSIPHSSLLLRQPASHSFTFFIVYCLMVLVVRTLKWCLLTMCRCLRWRCFQAMPRGCVVFVWINDLGHFPGGTALCSCIYLCALLSPLAQALCIAGNVPGSLYLRTVGSRSSRATSTTYATRR